MGETYRSNNGRGPLRAELVSVDGGMVTLRFINKKRSRTWKLAEWFFRSPSCGWVKEKKNANP